MNADEVCKMTDAIAEGESVEQVWTDYTEDNLTLKANENTLTIQAPFIFELDPRTASEIAVALATWACRQMNRPFSAKALLAPEQEVASRTNWYRRMIKIMSPETIQRNHDDLVKEIAEVHPHDNLKREDLQGAIDLLREAGAK